MKDIELKQIIKELDELRAVGNNEQTKKVCEYDEGVYCGNNGICPYIYDENVICPL